MLLELIVEQIRTTHHPITISEMCEAVGASPAEIVAALADQGCAPYGLPEAYLEQSIGGKQRTFRIVRPLSRDGYPQEGSGWGCYGE